MSQFERVVVTGLGAMTPLGVGVEKFWQGIKCASNGIGPITLIDVSKHTTRFGGEVTGFNPEDFVERKEARRMDRFVQLSVAASDEAIKGSGLVIADNNRDRVGVVIGCGVGGLQTWEREYRT
ncbi:MAG: beta-ketoacyl-[acyl-carrier-protein] synthase II, partial [Abitibacteriaceae bacterium]|nr:beta-ketoacyl-[acyl-carrier-protein] synthase II [Abditibacteriaceae bacterium]